MAARSQRVSSKQPIPYRVSERFSTADEGTIPFVSSDNVPFYIDRARLDRDAASFAPAGFVANPDEVVHLSEDSTTLDLLFRFVYREQHVRLSTLQFKMLASLAEAAEKYGVYSASTICRASMEARSESHPLQVMSYAAKHGHDDVLDVVGSSTISLDPAEVLAALSPRHFAAWVIYTNQYNRFMRDFIDHRIYWGVCDACKTALFCNALQKGPQGFAHLDVLFPYALLHDTMSWVGCCTGNKCKSSLEGLKRNLYTKIAKDAKPLTGFLAQ
ncbi:hypothetical protein BD626DRAFT_513952 [Schizophyllum amplum]|uniref:BTB domain-containing protein n=1 Tax=Schizophyllum amplum TaxID=97359 RepID=A0A550BZ49_9AGAR|nr:hypothetical protein BD626DRAFT_513952 [Auriculariopsis ampla]